MDVFMMMILEFIAIISLFVLFYWRETRSLEKKKKIDSAIATTFILCGCYALICLGTGRALLPTEYGGEIVKKTYQMENHLYIIKMQNEVIMKQLEGRRQQGVEMISLLSQDCRIPDWSLTLENREYTSDNPLY